MHHDGRSDLDARRGRLGVTEGKLRHQGVAKLGIHLKDLRAPDDEQIAAAESTVAALHEADDLQQSGAHDRR